MAKDWDQTLKDWTETIRREDEARGSASREEIERAVRTAPKLASKNIEIRVTGSYLNQTNIRAESDVDVAVVLHDVVFYTLPPGSSLTKEMLGLVDSDYTFGAWRSDVGVALRAHFGAANATEGNKAFNVRSSAQRLEADVAVFMEHRRYDGTRKGDGTWRYDEGVEMHPRDDPAKRIVNWPKQHQERATAKNEATRSRFKRLVRILKHLRAGMAGQENAVEKSAAGQVSSFFIECLVFNAPDTCFNRQEGGYMEDTKAVLDWLRGATRPGADGSCLVEVSGMERLFRSETGRAQAQAYAFASAGWQRIFGEGARPW
jgi:hypothetical protein